MQTTAKEDVIHSMRCGGCEYCKEQARLEGRNNIFNLIIDTTICPFCASILRDAHYCRECKEWVAVGLSGEDVVNMLKKKLSGGRK